MGCHHKVARAIYIYCTLYSTVPVRDAVALLEYKRALLLTIIYKIVLHSRISSRRVSHSNLARIGIALNPDSPRVFLRQLDIMTALSIKVYGRRVYLYKNKRELDHFSLCTCHKSITSSKSFQLAHFFIDFACI